VALSWGDVTVQGERLHLTWQHAKGGKVLRDLLEPCTSRAMLTWLHAYYGADLGTLAPTAPVWVSLATKYRGRRLSKAAIANTCEQRIGTAKVHTLRHTFSHSMRKAEVEIEEVHRRLGHTNLATTLRYLAGLASAENPHAAALADLFGI